MTAAQTSARTIAVFINGDERLIDQSATVALLLAQLLAAKGAGNQRVAVERNGEIVPKHRHGDTVLVAGDRLEIVIAVGGG